MKRGHNMPVAEHVNKVLQGIARKMGGGKVRIGFLEGAVYPDGTPVAAVAFWNEFGHEGNFPSPPRPFFRNMIKRESAGWGSQMATLAKATNFDGPRVLEIMGGNIANALQQSITEFNDVPLSETTLVLRARFWTNPQDITIRDVLSAQQTVAAQDGDMASGTQAKPLVWTGTMLRQVGYEVIK